MPSVQEVSVDRDRGLRCRSLLVIGQTEFGVYVADHAG
jgi:hypothetical protein